MGNCGSGAKKKGDKMKEELPKLEGNIAKNKDEAGNRLKEANSAANKGAEEVKGTA